MKRFFSWILLLALITAVLPAARAAEDELPEGVLYKGITSVEVSIRSIPSTDGERLITIPKGKRFYMYGCDPSWAQVTYQGVKGYIRRTCIETAEPLDPTVTPPYGVEVFAFTGIVKDTAPVLSAPGDGEVLITLYSGAKVALIGFEDGWGKCIFKRQYGYIDANCFASLIPTYADPETAGTDAPIAAYTSFYKITEDELNLGRMINIAVACDKLNAITFMPGQMLNFNSQIGPYNRANGYEKAPVLVNGETKPGYGGGTCQVSSTLYNVVLQLPGATVVYRRAHGPGGASYLPHGVDAAVGNSYLNFKFRNDYGFPIRIVSSAQDGALYMSIYRVEE